MILTSKISNKLIFAVALLFLPLFSHAQQSVSLSVSPTLFDMTAEPGKAWSSNLRVINSNSFPITVYLDTVNFAPQGESGQGMFLPINATESQGQTLAEWIVLKDIELVIPPEQTAEIPFSIAVPQDAAPGGHFAAVLVGTRPPAKADDTSRVETSQIVTSLVFLRVTGNVAESGQIRSFRTTKRILEEPQATFELRFQNTGNVHIQPQGEIVIYNMWGQERGTIPINRGTMFGNVLPDSIRAYAYTWTGEWSFSDIGRYTAIATLGFGSENRNFASSEISFWVIPWKAVAGVMLALFGFISFMIWAVRAYVTRMLILSGVDPKAIGKQGISRRVRPAVSVAAPIEVGILDLRRTLAESENWSDRATSLSVFVRKNWLFFLTVVALVFVTLALVWYVRDASVSERSFEVVVEDSAGRGEAISSEQLKYEELRSGSRESSPATTTKSLPALRIVNQSGISGLAASLRISLEQSGYLVADLSNELDSDQENTVIVYAPEFASEALALSRNVPGALLSAYDGATGSETPITIYVGKDFKNTVQ